VPRITHRRYLPERGGPGSAQSAALERSWRRLDVIGRVFLVLAGVQLAIAVWPIAEAAMAGVTGGGQRFRGGRLPCPCQGLPDCSCKATLHMDRKVA